jgi:hypothetical protein
LRREGSIIGGTITTIWIIGIGVVVGLIIFAYALYITVFPLFKTIRGALQVLKKRGEQRAGTAITEEEHSIAGLQLGLTMADGGDHVEEHKVPVQRGEPDRF